MRPPRPPPRRPVWVAASALQVYCYCLLFLTFIWAVVGDIQIPPCSLNGNRDKKSAGQCVCDVPWIGPDCDILDVRPIASFPQGYGMLPNQTTWGGSVLYRDGQYHLYVSVMRYGCPLRQWVTHSEIQHAVADQPQGPYLFRDVAVPVLSHNPKVIELADGKLALIHIFKGINSTTTVNTPIQAAQDGECSMEEAKHHEPFVPGAVTPAVADIPNMRRRRQITRTKMASTTSISTDNQVEGGGTIHVADSPYGPWTPLSNNTLGQCNNPAPFVVFASCEKAHVIYVVCSAGSHGVLKRAEDIHGPWETISMITPRNDPPYNVSISVEDPTLWIDRRGFHILYHAYVYESGPDRGRDCTDSVVSAYIFSEDGKTWYYGNRRPFSNLVHVDNGHEEAQQSMTLATRERPSLIFAKDDVDVGTLRMTHLLTAACGTPNCAEGPRGGCVNCKYDHWDFTLIQPLATET